MYRSHDLRSFEQALKEKCTGLKPRKRLHSIQPTTGKRRRHGTSDDSDFMSCSSRRSLFLDDTGDDDCFVSGDDDCFDAVGSIEYFPSFSMHESSNDSFRSIPDVGVFDDVISAHRPVVPRAGRQLRSLEVPQEERVGFVLAAGCKDRLSENRSSLRGDIRADDARRCPVGSVPVTYLRSDDDFDMLNGLQSVLDPLFADQRSDAEEYKA